MSRDRKLADARTRLALVDKELRWLEMQAAQLQQTRSALSYEIVTLEDAEPVERHGGAS